jgi:uncharacterized protein (DUF1501 family)
MLWGSHASIAQAVGDRVLVLVFMRGGWDGLNVLVPYGDDAYYSLRPTIAVKPPAIGGDAAALDIDGFFGFHPAMQGIWRLYQDGWVAAMPAVHYAQSSRSHFVSQEVIESAYSPSGSTGWLARYFMASGGADLARALSFGVKPSFSLLGLPTPSPAFQDIGSLELARGGADYAMLADAMQKAYSWPASTTSPNSAGLLSIGSRLVPELESLTAIGKLSPENGANYPLSTFGRQLHQAASMIKKRAGLEVITLDYGGWDTHSNEGADVGGRMGSRLADFSAAVEAFFTDLGGAASRVVLLTATEFGRTAAENGSKGTDHGNASTWLAIGPQVRGGLHLGTGWPGLAPDRLVDGRALAHTIDFRSVYSNVLTQFLGASSVSGILPSFAPDGLSIIA